MNWSIALLWSLAFIIAAETFGHVTGLVANKFQPEQSINNENTKIHSNNHDINAYKNHPKLKHSGNYNDQTDDDHTLTNGGITAATKLLTFHSKIHSKNQRKIIRSKRRAAAAGESVYYDHVDWRDVIESLIDLECGSSGLSINLRFNTRHARLLGQKLRRILKKLSMETVIAKVQQNETTVNDQYHTATNNKTSGSEVDNNGLNLVESDIVKICRGERDVSEDQVTLKIPYCSGCCGMVVEQSVNNNGTIYNVSISVRIDNETAREVEMSKPFDEIYHLSCLNLPLIDTDHLGQMKLLLSEDVRGKKLYNNTNYHPKEILVNEHIYIQGALTFNHNLRPIDLKSFPLNCYLLNSDEQATQESAIIQRRQHLRLLFLQNGCPARDYRSRGLSTIHHFLDGNTRIGFQLVDYLLAPLTSTRLIGNNINNNNNNNVSFTVACDVMACVHSNLHGLNGVPKCALTTYCSAQQTTGQPKLPFDVQSKNIFRVKSGLLLANLQNVQQTRNDLQNDYPRSKPNRLFSNNNLNEININNNNDKDCRTCSLNTNNRRAKFGGQQSSLQQSIVNNNNNNNGANYYNNNNNNNNDNDIGSPRIAGDEKISSSLSSSSSTTTIHYVEGISTRAAIFLALASFLCGITVTGLIWFVQKRDLADETRRKAYEMTRHECITGTTDYMNPSNLIRKDSWQTTAIDSNSSETKRLEAPS